MKIGIISDTHSKVKKASRAVDMLIKNGAEYIIHAGDIGKYDTLQLLKDSGQKYVAVYGNNDAHLIEYHNSFNLVQEPHYFELEDLKIKLMHLPFYMSPDSEVVIFGHTHEFSCEFINGTLFLNPGESCARNKPVSECALLEVTKDNFFVTYYTREKKADFVKTKEFTFQRKK
jgi:uncharacterized protein